MTYTLCGNQSDQNKRKLCCFVVVKLHLTEGVSWLVGRSQLHNLDHSEDSSGLDNSYKSEAGELFGHDPVSACV